MNVLFTKRIQLWYRRFQLAFHISYFILYTRKVSMFSKTVSNIFASDRQTSSGRVGVVKRNREPRREKEINKTIGKIVIPSYPKQTSLPLPRKKSPREHVPSNDPPWTVRNSRGFTPTLRIKAASPGFVRASMHAAVS